MKISRRTALQGTAGAFALGLGGFNFDFTKAHAQAPAVKRGGTLNFAISAEAPHYDPHGSDTYATLHLAGPFYSTLMRFNLSKFPAIEGDLAQSWTVAPDLMTYTFKLHPNVKFADGTPLTAEDVVFTVKLIADKNLPQRAYLPTISDATRSDRITLTASTRPSRRCRALYTTPIPPATIRSSRT